MARIDEATRSGAFTPGPWYAHTAANGSAVSVCADMGAQVASVKSGHPNTKGRKVANARLMAAAPDMLETLRWLDSIGGLGVAAHENIRAAIAKATGEKA